MDISAEVKKIAVHYGYTEQSEQLTEECAELIQAVSKYRRATKKGVTEKIKIALDNIIEEIADVEVMIEQIKYLLQLSEEDIQAVKIFKVNRTKEDIAKEKGE